MLLVALMCAAFFCGCDSRNLFGTIEDNFGRPVKGATVENEKTHDTAVTDSAGRFELDYRPGEFRITAYHESFIREYRTVSAPQQTRHPLGKIVLVKVPTNDGLEVQSAHDYVLADKADFPSDAPAGAAPSCRRRLPPKQTPSCSGRMFVAFAPSAPKNNQVLVRVRDGVVWSSGCAAGAPEFVNDLTWEHMGAQEVIRGKLADGVYCLTEQAPSGKGEAVLGDSGACFRWDSSQKSAVRSQ